MLTFVFSKEKGHVTDLPIAYPVPSPTEYANFMDKTYLNFNVLDVDNKNLTIGQQELLQWHFQLGHFNMEWIQRLLRVQEGENDSALSHKSKANTCDRPQCADFAQDETTIDWIFI